MTIIRSTALALALVVGAGAAAQAQPTPAKTYYQPKSKQEFRAEQAARAEREARVRQASADIHQRHEEVFSKVDSDRNGRLSLQEFKEAQLHLQRDAATKTP